jgi:REP element-mobilizing transposase RayT
MPANSELPVRRTTRRKDFDYSSAAIYFVTICTQNRRNLFGAIENARMQPNRFGRLVQEAWFELPDHYARLTLDVFTLMPNHVHGVLALTDPVGAGLRPARAANHHGLSEIVGVFKSFSSRRIAELDNSLRGKIWQRSFYDHIIRNEQDLRNVRRYIFHNPARWEFDRENTNCKKDVGEL